MLNLDAPGSSERWMEAYVAGAWLSWVIPLLIFTASLASETLEKENKNEKKLA